MFSDYVATFAAAPAADRRARVASASRAKTSALAAASAMHATTSSQNDAEFLSPVTVGGQTLVMDFDTGSSDMYVILPASNLRIL